jgi:hypothetical protein
VVDLAAYDISATVDLNSVSKVLRQLVVLVTTLGVFFCLESIQEFNMDNESVFAGSNTPCGNFLTCCI